MDAGLVETLAAIREWIAALEGGSDPVSRRAVAVEMRAWLVAHEETPPGVTGEAPVPFWHDPPEHRNPF